MFQGFPNIKVLAYPKQVSWSCNTRIYDFFKNTFLLNFLFFSPYSVVYVSANTIHAV
jgi:hypothetical protein